MVQAITNGRLVAMCVGVGVGRGRRINFINCSCLNEKDYKKKIIILYFVILIACKTTYIKEGAYSFMEYIR